MFFWIMFLTKCSLIRRSFSECTMSDSVLTLYLVIWLKTQFIDERPDLITLLITFRGLRYLWVCWVFYESWHVSLDNNMNPIYMNPIYMNPVYMNPIYMNPIYINPVYINLVYINLVYITWLQKILYFKRIPRVASSFYWYVLLNGIQSISYNNKKLADTW